jgi:cupin 2 domain-containing protein
MEDTIRVQNLFENLPSSLPEEQLDELAMGEGFRLERIISTAHATPADQWYDQGQDEWVMLLRGAAGLRFEDQADLVTMGPGDCLLIPAHCRHRVEWTHDKMPTVWLALHFSRPVAPAARRPVGPVTPAQRPESGASWNESSRHAPSG